MIGPPDYPDSKIPTWEEFINDYLEYYFTGTHPFKGRCFIIVYNSTDIGQINYNEIDTETRTTDLDIWLSDKKYTGKGYGTEAINILCEQLNKEFGCTEFKLSPSKRNARAIRAYEKAGFVITDELLEDHEKDYEDNRVLTKTSIT